ncbi:unnamed protein product [Cylindrotheca closterium]|uniref:Uncharacterized protein n=1 Tax=Cylindrotheca closterium TaxID=2856 RepID=A0AAD2G0D5_9STRA|nr:unnamed protein product [Cylindrotheca closterium]
MTTSKHSSKTTLLMMLGHLAVLLCFQNNINDNNNNLAMMMANAIAPPKFGAITTMQSRRPDFAAVPQVLSLGDSTTQNLLTTRGGDTLVIRRRRYRAVDLGVLAICIVALPTVTIPIIRLGATIVVAAVVVNALTGHGFVVIR